MTNLDRCMNCFEFSYRQSEDLKSLIPDCVVSKIRTQDCPKYNPRTKKKTNISHAIHTVDNSNPPPWFVDGNKRWIPDSAYSQFFPEDEQEDWE